VRRRPKLPAMRLSTILPKAAVLAALTLAAPAAANAASFPLVGWWPMNEGSGQVVRDWSGKGNHGVLGSTPQADANDPSWVRGVFLGSALRFDGADDFITIPGSSALEPQRLTVSAWVKNDGTPGAFKYVLAKGADACDRSSYGLYTGAGGGLAFYVSGATQVALSPAEDASVWDGKWHNVAGTYDGATVRLYVDGEQVGTGAPAPAAIDYDLPARGVQLANYGDASSGCYGALNLRGDIDGVQVWSQALPVDSIWRSLRSLLTLAR
jgi:hypothetical protein